MKRHPFNYRSLAHMLPEVILGLLLLSPSAASAQKFEIKPVAEIKIKELPVLVVNQIRTY
jgi:hypothetical protein